MSMYGITINPMMMNVGSTTPACQGSKKTSISCNPRKCHGPFAGFGVRVGLAGSSSGASTSSAQTISSSVITIAHRNSERTRNGQVWTLSSPGPVAFLIGTSTRLPATAPSGVRASGVAMCQLSSSSSRSADRRADQKSSTSTRTKKNGSVITRPPGMRNERTIRTSARMEYLSSDGIAASQRRTGESVAADPPEMHAKENAGDERNEDAVQDVEAQQCVRANLAAAEEERPRIVDVVQPRDQLVPGALVPQDRGGAAHVRSHRHRPDGELVPGQQVAGEGEEQREHEEEHTDHPVELARRFVGSGQEDAEHVEPDGDHHPVRRPAMHVPHQHPEGHIVLE